MAVETSNPYVPTYRLVPVSTEQRFTSESDIINTVNYSTRTTGSIN